MNDIDTQTARAFEESAIVAGIERAARKLRASLAGSAVIAAAAPWLRSIRARGGDVLVAATLTHIVLMAAIARPSSWQWLILPVIFLAAGLVLAVTAPPDRT